MKIEIVFIKKIIIMSCLLCLCVLQSEAQSRITLYVDSLNQPLQTLSLGACDTIVVESFYSILAFCDTSLDLNDYELTFNPCNITNNETPYDCNLIENEFEYNTNYTSYFFYDILPAANILITHQHSNKLFFITKPESCALANISENSEIGTFNIYPNPTNGMLNIPLGTDTLNTVNVKFITLAGQTAFESVYKGLGQNKISINVSTLSSGIYFVEVSVGSNFILKQKCIIQHNE
jgi:hypothetical protein